MKKHQNEKWYIHTFLKVLIFGINSHFDFYRKWCCFVKIKSHNSLLFFLGGIVCAMAMTFCNKVSAKIVEVKDPESRKVVMRCDNVAEEVTISDEFAEFNTRGELVSDEEAIQRALRTYMYGIIPIIDYDKQENPIYDYDSFYSEYRFIPKKITFANVTYEVDWRPIVNGEPMRANRMTITSNGGKYIYPPCIAAFGCSPQWVHAHFNKLDVLFAGRPVPESQRTIVPEVKIIGQEFTTIPDGCFCNMYGLETVDATETSINKIANNAFFNCNEIRRIDLSNSTNDYSIEHAGIRAYNKENRTYMYKGGTHHINYYEMKSDFEGNIRDTLAQKYTETNEAQERDIEERMQDQGMYINSLLHSACTCCGSCNSSCTLL